MTASIERRDLDLTGITAVEVATFGGELSVVTGAERPRVEASVYGNATWSVERVGSLLYIVGKKRGFFYMGNGVSLRLWLPERLTLTLANVSAAIRMRGDAESLAATVTHGSIEVRASTVQRARLRAVNGNVVAHGVTGKLDIVTTPGDVRVFNCGGEVQITATPGNVRLEQIMLTPGRSHVVTASPGNIEIVSIHTPSGLNLHARTTQPPIVSDLPEAERHPKSHHIRVRRRGPNPANLHVTAVGRLSIKE